MRLFKFEFDKVYRNPTIILGLIVSVLVSMGIFFIGYRYSQNYMSQLDNAKGGYTTNIDEKIKHNYSGDFTDEKVKLIVSDYLKLTQNEKNEKGLDSSNFSFYPFYWETLNTFVKGGYPSLATKMNKSFENKQDKVTVNDIELIPISSLVSSSDGKPLTLGNFVPWVDFFNVLGNIFLLCSVLVILICSLIFSNDTSKNINQLLFSTKYGATKLNKIKLVLGLLSSILIVCLFQIVNFLVFSKTFDTSGGTSSIQTNLILQLFEFPLDWSHWQVLMLIMLIQLITILIVASFTMLVSTLSKNPMSAFAISLGLFFLPKLLEQIFRFGLINELLMMLPINIGVPKSFLASILSISFLSNNIIFNLLIMTTIFLFFILMFNVISYRKMKNWKYN